ncbi:uncharacterized protein LOC111016196 [Momordica charantia]|uniref:Uncharacterized protein LOC111016196 n=1 Tax=Momordica charantia TaxID=3673 RepID=A0A6J1D094_MOMCH|nr:uncharacterized protein LOC111016196 [Momordica charantia]
MDKLCEKFSFKQYKSSKYNVAANGLAEAFNKTLCNLLKILVSKTKRDWQEKISEVLWAHRTTHRAPTGATPYSLVYGVEAILPLEREIPSLQKVVLEGLTIEDNAKLRLQELEALHEKRLDAQQILECYQTRMTKASIKMFGLGHFRLVIWCLLFEDLSSRRVTHGISPHLNGTDPTSSNKSTQMERIRSLIKID